MPLSAIVDGETIIGPNLSKEEWEHLRLRHKKGLSIKMCCCGAPGHLRISKKGTQHFYHKTNVGCEWEHESIAHLEIKNMIFQLCKSENWETYTEYPASDRNWISDVYAIKDGKKIVFEIQISKIPISVLEERDKKYQNEGIESYWLLNNYLGKSDEFRSAYYEHLHEEENQLQDYFPYIDHSIFDTGPENHLFITKGIRSIGLDAKNLTLYTTKNPEVKIEEWVLQVLNDGYKKYLDDNSAYYHHKRELRNLAGPFLIRFNDFFNKIICDKQYKNDVDRYYRFFKNNEVLRMMTSLKKQFNLAYFESDRLDKTYRSFVSPRKGLFIWKQLPGFDLDEEPFFRLESELKINELKKCVDELDQLEGFYNTAFGRLAEEINSTVPYIHESRRKKPDIRGEENDQTSIIVNTHVEKQEISIPSSITWKVHQHQFSKKDKTNEKLWNSPYVYFECVLNIGTNWLTHSSGICYQVCPGLKSQLPEEVAKEFEQKGFGKLCDTKNSEKE